MPLIAMTREMGSLGKDVAAAIGERMGRPVVHHEIIDQLASKMRLRKSHVIRFLDGKASMWERLTTDKTSLSIYTADETLQMAQSESVAVIRGWGSAHLNTERVSIEECADEVMSLARNPQFLETAASRQMIADLALESHVRAALRADPRTAKLDISISAEKGTVTLAGIVERSVNPIDAEQIAGVVPGANAVRNQLKIAMASRIKID